MAELETNVAPVVFKDRVTGLLIFGICQCVLGIMCAMAIPFMLLSIIITKINPEIAAQTQTNPIHMIPGILVYALGAAWFVFMGIGSIKRRRWARALTLISSWLWLIGGIGGLVLVILIMPITAPQVPAGQPQLPQEFFLIMRIMMIAISSVTYVLIPLVLVLFYGGKNVRLTCEHWDEEQRWTDKCPLPVLGMCIAFALWGFSMINTCFQNFAVPFFGTVIDSYTGAAVIIPLVIILLLLAWRMYKLNTLAWWASAVVLCGWIASLIITLLGNGMWEYYEKLGLQTETVDAMKMYTANRTAILIVFGIWTVAVVSYLIFIKRYFKKDTLQDNCLTVEQV
jgi:hypothetical protein